MEKFGTILHLKPCNKLESSSSDFVEGIRSYLLFLNRIVNLQSRRVSTIHQRE